MLFIALNASRGGFFIIWLLLLFFSGARRVRDAALCLPSRCHFFFRNPGGLHCFGTRTDRQTGRPTDRQDWGETFLEPLHPLLRHVLSPPSPHHNNNKKKKEKKCPTHLGGATRAAVLFVLFAVCVRVYGEGRGGATLPTGTSQSDSRVVANSSPLTVHCSDHSACLPPSLSACLSLALRSLSLLTNRPLPVVLDCHTGLNSF